MMNVESSLFLPSGSFLIVVVCIVVWLLQAYVKFRLHENIINKIPGPETRFLRGNIDKNFGKTDVERFRRKTSIEHLYGRKSNGISRIWMGPLFPLVLLSSPEAVELFLSSSTELKKGAFYNFVKPWLGEGLITTSNGQRWFSHRKLLTPAFHFKILEEFLLAMNKQSKILVELLRKEATGDTFDILPYIKMCALDIICESAMGISIHAQTNRDSKYVTAIKRFIGISFLRLAKPWLRVQPIFRLTKYHNDLQQAVATIKGFTNQVIQERKKAMKNVDDYSEGVDEHGKKRRIAFLDLVLSTKGADGKPAMTDEQIQEEVDTFMFAGHDTTTHGICWCLFMLGLHPEFQEKCYEELYEIFGDSDRDPTSNDLRQMKYLECCMKESQRVYPSVPAFGRMASKDLTICNYHIPAGTSCAISVYSLHNNPDVWPDPQKFDPERFKTENIAGMHPYSFIPFSAGPRNCLGQKFALMEEKAVLSRILRSFKVTTADRRDMVDIFQFLILASAGGFNLKITPR